MRTSKILAAILAAGTSIAAAPADPPPAVLASTGAWNVHYNDKLCLLSHGFGTGDAAVDIGFQPIFNEDRMDVLLLSRDTSAKQRIGTATLRFAPSGQELTGTYYSTQLTGGTQRFTRIGVSSEAFALMKASTEMTLMAKPHAITVRLPRPDKAVAAFRKCETDLLQSWGIDPSAVAADRSAKAIEPWRVFGPDSYPSEARMKGWIGRVVALVQVDAAGKPTSCRVVAGVAAPLNAVTCDRAMTRVRYTPGSDAAGKAAASLTVLAVTWNLDG